MADDDARGRLRTLSARRIIGHVADAAERWSDADHPPRVRATLAIEARLGYSQPVVDYALDRLFCGVTRDTLGAAIAAELGGVAALDAIVARHGAPAAWARGVDRVTIVSSDTTIGVGMMPALFALCAKCDVVVKDRDDALVTGFFASLAQEHPAFASAARAYAWTGGDDPAEAALLERSDAVVAFGRDETLRTIRARCGVDTRFVGFGHRTSIGRLTREDVAALDDALADRIVRDALLYDGEGCLSLHALFVHADAATLARVVPGLAAACERVAIEFPSGARSAARTAAVTSYTTLAAFRAAGGCGAVLRAGDAALIADPPRDEAPPFLPRVLPLFGVDGDEAIAAYAAAHRLPVQAVGVVAADAAAFALAERIGAVRVAAFGTMQDPPPGGHHGGAPRIADFVRWIDGE